MKKHIILILAILVCLGCKKENATLSKVKEATEAVKNTTNILTSVNEAKEKVANLKDLKPITAEAIKAWMPDQLKSDLKRKSYKLGNSGMVNIGIINLQYENPDHKPKKLNIEIIDGAGAGSGVVYMYTMIGKTTLDSETNNGYEKIHKRDGVSVKEKYTKQKYTSIIKMEFLANDRFAVNARGYNIEPDEFWEYMKALKLDELKE